MFDELFSILFLWNKKGRRKRRRRNSVVDLFVSEEEKKTNESQGPEVKKVYILGWITKKTDYNSIYKTRRENCKVFDLIGESTRIDEYTTFCACVNMYICMQVWLFEYVCMCECLLAFVCMSVYVCKCVCMSVCLLTNVSLWVSECIYECLCVRMCCNTYIRTRFLNGFQHARKKFR